MDDLFTWPCPGKPEELLGQPIGMYHCEYCGEMQLAGMTHIPEHWSEPFPKIDYEDDWGEEPDELGEDPA